MAFGDSWQIAETQPDSLAGDLMDKTETARFLGVAVRTLEYWVQSGSIPDGVVFNKTKRLWSRFHLSRFIAERFIEQQRQVQKETR